MRNGKLILVTAIMMCLVFSSSAQATIQWNYDSPLTVYETVSYAGMGYYRYEYSFTNTDTSPIWRFGVFTKYPARGENTFIGYDAWLKPLSLSVNDTYPEYNGKNLDSNIIDVTGSYYEVGRAGVSGPAIQVGETASGFSLISYDNSPKFYFYETIASGYTQTNGTGKVAAVGVSVPEPCTILLLAFGGGLLIKRRFSEKV